MEFARIAKRSEQNIPERHVGEVVIVQPHAVMDAVGFRALNDVAEPLRRAHVPVLEIAGERVQVADERRRQRLQTEHDYRREQQEGDLHQHLQRMKHHRTGNVHAIGAVVQLVQRAPEKIHAVHGPMVGIVDAFEHDKANYRATDNAELRAVEPAVRFEPIRGNQQRRDGGNRADQNQKTDADPLPALARWKRARRPELFRDPQDEIRDGGEQPDDVDGIHDGLRGLTELTLHRKSLAKV